jgi:hypothetical protein
LERRFVRTPPKSWPKNAALSDEPSLQGRESSEHVSKTVLALVLYFGYSLQE